MKLSKLMSASLTLLCLSACKAGGPQVDAEIMQAFEGVIANCEVSASGNTVTQCKNEEMKNLKKMFQAQGQQPAQKDKIKAIDTFAHALTHEKPEMGVVASSTMYSVMRNFGKNPDKTQFQAAPVQRLIEAVGKSPKYQAAQALRGTVHAAMLADQSNALYTMMDGHSYDQIPILGYPHIMRYARMDAFPKVQELAKSAQEENMLRAAFKAPKNMPKPTEQELGVICPWAKGYLSDPRDGAYLGAGRLMLSCGGEYIDALLDEGEKRLAEQDRFTRDDYLLYRDVCFTPIKGMIKEAGKEAQCQRTADFLEAAVNNEKVASRDRGLALFAIYYQRRNAESMKVMQKYKDHADENIQKYARDSIKSLVETYNIPEQ